MSRRNRSSCSVVCLRSGKWAPSLPIAVVVVSVSLWVFGSATAFGQEAPPEGTAGPSPAELDVALDTLWVMIAGMLVFWMNAGFGMVESGLCRAKNCVNILSKNTIVFAVTSLAYLALGFGLMFGDGNGFVGLHGLWFLTGSDNSPATGDAYSGVYSSINWATVPLEAKFFFQLVFAGTAATIVSGCVAERIKYLSFILFSFAIALVMYPITGHWIWGGGWLANFGMWDFAGSTVVHSVGGWAGLAGILVLGPRIGKYGRDGRVNPLPGHNMTSVMLGVMILWLGWFGFNPGSTMNADGAAIAHVALTTNTAASAAALSATITAWLLIGKPDLSMTLNGVLAGLVAITAPCAWVSSGSAILIGLVAGVLVVLGVLGFDKARIDDPVGALSVHLLNGIWGTLAVGLFAQDKFAPGTTGDGLFFGGGVKLLFAQLVGVVAVGLFTFIAAWLVWLGVKVITAGVRVTEAEEHEGLDIGEHGMEAYAIKPGA